KVVQGRQLACRSDLEHCPTMHSSSTTVGTASLGCSIKVPVACQDQTGVGVSTVVGVERHQLCQLACRGDLEDRSNVGATAISCPIEVAVPSLHQRGHRTCAIGSVELCQCLERPRGGADRRRREK